MLMTVLSGTHTALSPARHSLPVLIHILSLHGELSTHISPFSAAITIPLSSVNSRFSAISSRDSVKTVTPSDVTTAVSDVFALVYLYAVSTVKEFLKQQTSVKKVIFNVFKDLDRQIYRRLLGEN